jgi:dihydrofolate reductase
MRRVRYAVATSLDGFIAGPNGEYDWIVMGPDPAAYFKSFYAQFDIAIMGRRTFDVVGRAIEGMRTYVFSRTLPPGPYKDVTVVGEDGLAQLREIREEDGKDVWLFGGGVLFGTLASAGLVDSVELGVMPVLLGAGQPLMLGNTGRVQLKLIKSESSPQSVLSLNYAVDHASARP